MAVSGATILSDIPRTTACGAPRSGASGGGLFCGDLSTITSRQPSQVRTRGRVLPADCSALRPAAEPDYRQPDRGLQPHLCRKTQRHGRRAVSGWACGCATMPWTSPVHCVRAPPFRCVRRGTFLGEAAGRRNSSCGRQAAEPLGGCEQLKSDPSRRWVSGPSRESCCCFATPVAGSGRQEDRVLERVRYGAIIKPLTIPRTIACGPPRLGASGGGFFLSGHSTHCAGILRDKIDPSLPAKRNQLLAGSKLLILSDRPLLLFPHTSSGVLC